MTFLETLLQNLFLKNKMLMALNINSNAFSLLNDEVWSGDKSGRIRGFETKRPELSVPVCL